jgi:hypothetical protein
MTTARALAVLERLERQALDEASRQLARNGAALDKAGRTLVSLRSERTGEDGTGWSMQGGTAVLAAYWQRSRNREQGCCATLDGLQQERKRLLDAVLDRLAEAKRLELQQIRETADRRRGAERAERLQIEDLILSRRAASAR